MPKDKGGLGFSSLFDVSKALFAKLWWIFRTKNTLWTNFIEGHASVWFDNWTQLGGLHFLMHISHSQSQMEDVKELYAEDGWKINALESNFNED
ncbi:hypothetical protein H5410_021880 [Solanum commersonii]|uniref:Uncharacterized protein n=1 Tax=Solanum commersonii TaxID=4109 RepID=A0A9J5ZF78_SOLCO|nr:hypothetical protein H5410_021880 [Solanum commersonii]